MQQSSPSETNEIHAFGYRFHPYLKRQLLDLIFGPRTEKQIVVASANLHGLYMFERCREYRELHAQRETKVIIDGMPIVWLLKLLGHKVSRDHRTTWMDWFEDALDRAAREKRRVFILGHTADALAAGFKRAAAKWPDLEIDGCDGFFDIQDDAACRRIVEKINRKAPNIVFIGMGMPKQEIFAARYASMIDAPTVGLGGAAFAYFAGDQAAPPRWVGYYGLEWAYRLACDPARLARRYLLEPILLAYLAATRLVRARAVVSNV